MVTVEQTWTKVIENEFRTVFARVGGHGVVTIDKIPEIDVVTIEVTGYTYTIGSSKKYSRYEHCKTFEEALAAAEKKMEQFD